MIVTTEYYDQLLAAEMVANHVGASAGPLYNAECMLFINSIVPAKDTVLADLDPPTYGTYGNTTPTFSGPVRDSSERTALISDLQLFQQANGDPELTIVGWALIDSGGTHLLMAEVFDPPQGLIDEFSFVAFTINLTFQQTDPGTADITQ